MRTRFTGSALVPPAAVVLTLLALPVGLGAEEPAALAAAGLPPELFEELAGLERELGDLQAASEVLPPAVPAEAVPAPALPPTSTEELTAGAFQELEATGRAPIVAIPGGELFPFGQTVPTLRCLPDRACDIELEAGEVVDGLALGDAARWEAAQFFEGEAPLLAPHVLLKPHEAGLRTNLVLVTNRRTYHLELEAPEEGELGEKRPVAYHHHVAFWYPDAWARKLRSAADAEEARAVQEQAARALPEGLPGKLSFRYRVIRPTRRSRRLPWEPVTVFDDGRRTYIVLPPAARAEPLPAVLAVRGDGYEALNAQLHGDWLVIPSLLSRAELVHGTGKSRRSLTLVRED